MVSFTRSQRLGLRTVLLVAIVIGLAICVPTLGVHAAGEVLDQANESITDSISTAWAYFGQSFTAGRTGNLTRVELKIDRNDVDRTVQIRTVAMDGTPTATVVATGTLTTTIAPVWMSVALTPQPAIISGTAYAIIVVQPTDFTSYAASVSNPYATGMVVNSDDGSTWINWPADDFAFRTFVADSSTAVTLSSFKANSPFDLGAWLRGFLRW